MPIQTPFDTGWLCLISLLLFFYYLIYKIQPLVKLVDHLLTAGLHRTFDVIQGLSNVFGQPRLYSTFHWRVRPSKVSGGVGRHRWKLRACKRSSFHWNNCSSGRHGCNKLHPFCTRPSTKKRQPKHFRAARCAWKAHRPLDPDGWKWWRTKPSLSRPQQILHRNASNCPQPVPHWKVAMKLINFIKCWYRMTPPLSEWLV